MMWVAAFTSRASPAPETMVSLRSRYCAAGSWSHAQAPEQVRLAANAAELIMHLIFMVTASVLGRDRGQSRGAADYVPVWALDIAAAGDVVAKFLLLLHLT